MIFSNQNDKASHYAIMAVYRSETSYMFSDDNTANITSRRKLPALVLLDDALHRPLSTFPKKIETVLCFVYLVLENAYKFNIGNVSQQMEAGNDTTKHVA